MRTCRWDQLENSRLALWLVAFPSVAMTAAVYHWLPGWVPAMRIVSCAGSAVAIVWLWTPACKRWLTRHGGRTS